MRKRCDGWVEQGHEPPRKCDRTDFTHYFSHRFNKVRLVCDNCAMTHSESMQSYFEVTTEEAAILEVLHA